MDIDKYNIFTKGATEEEIAELTPLQIADLHIRMMQQINNI